METFITNVGYISVVFWCRFGNSNIVYVLQLPWYKKLVSNWMSYILFRQPFSLKIKCFWCRLLETASMDLLVVNNSKCRIMKKLNTLRCRCWYGTKTGTSYREIINKPIEMANTIVTFVKMLYFESNFHCRLLWKVQLPIRKSWLRRWLGD